MENDKVQLFEDQPIRTAWVEDEAEWYFSIVDVVGALTEQVDYEKARKYWNKLKQRLNEEGSQLVTNCHQLKMKSVKDGKRYNTDVANTEQLLRLIQSIPSKKAEPFKMWLAQVGRERMEEVIDPELTIERALETYAKKAILGSGLISAFRLSKSEKNSLMNGIIEALRRVLNMPSLQMR
jgi:hypothetical protein